MNPASPRTRRRKTDRDPTSIADLLPYQAAMASWLLSDYFRRRYLTKEFGLGIGDWRILAMIGERGQSTAAALVSDTGLDHVIFHRAVKALESKGLVARKIDPAYRRSKILRLTAAGRRCHRRLLTKARELDATIHDWIGTKNFATTLAALKRINQEGRRL